MSLVARAHAHTHCAFAVSTLDTQLHTHAHARTHHLTPTHARAALARTHTHTHPHTHTNPPSHTHPRTHARTHARITGTRSTGSDSLGDVRLPAAVIVCTEYGPKSTAQHFADSPLARDTRILVWCKENSGDAVWQNLIPKILKRIVTQHTPESIKTLVAEYDDLDEGLCGVIIPKPAQANKAISDTTLTPGGLEFSSVPESECAAFYQKYLATPLLTSAHCPLFFCQISSSPATWTSRAWPALNS